MHFQADDDFPRPRGAFDQLGVGAPAHAHADLHQACGAAVKSRHFDGASGTAARLPSSNALPMI